MDEISKIKYLKDKRKLSYRQISNITGYDWRTIKKWYESNDFPQYKRNKQHSPVKDKIIQYIKDWIEEDSNLIRKGKLIKTRTASKMHEDFINMGIECSVRTVQKYVAENKPKEAFIEQEYFPAEDMQVD